MSDYEAFVRTPIEIVHEKLLLSELGPGECLLDPGCGDGAVLIHGAREFGARCVGVEVRPDLAEAAREAGRLAGVDEQLEIRCEDFMESDVSGVDVVVIYLTLYLMGPLSIKLENELSAGARIVTHTFDLPGWEAEDHVQRTDRAGQIHDLYLYRAGGQSDGGRRVRGRGRAPTSRRGMGTGFPRGDDPRRQPQAGCSRGTVGPRMASNSEVFGRMWPVGSLLPGRLP